MLGVLLTVALISALGIAIAVVVATRPQRAALRGERMRAIKSVHVSRNHQEMFLLLLDLKTLDERGFMSIFPDKATAERARQLTDAYREEIAP